MPFHYQLNLCHCCLVPLLLNYCYAMICSTKLPPYTTGPWLWGRHKPVAELRKGTALPAYLISRSVRCFSNARWICCSACLSLHNFIFGEEGQIESKDKEAWAHLIKLKISNIKPANVPPGFFRSQEQVTSALHLGQEALIDACSPKLARQIGGAAWPQSRRFKPIIGYQRHQYGWTFSCQNHC